jgi:hypothetical protein
VVGMGIINYANISLNFLSMRILLPYDMTMTVAVLIINTD